MFTASLPLHGITTRGSPERRSTTSTATSTTTAPAIWNGLRTAEISSILTGCLDASPPGKRKGILTLSKRVARGRRTHDDAHAVRSLEPCVMTRQRAWNAHRWAWQSRPCVTRADPAQGRCPIFDGNSTGCEKRSSKISKISGSPDADPLQRAAEGLKDPQKVGCGPM